MLETSALCKRYRDFAALNGLDMHIPKGSIYGFVGRNGAGKTTLIRLICGLQEPQSERAARYLAVIRERTDAMRSLTEERSATPSSPPRRRSCAGRPSA